MKGLFISKEFEKYFKKHPFVIVDIGARGGIPQLWKYLSHHLQIIGFEPDKEEHEKLSNAKNLAYQTKYLNTALSDGKRPLKLFLFKSPWLSSIYHPNDSLLRKFLKTGWEVASAVELESDTLDNQFNENNISDADLIKVDTQGSEFIILKGARGTMANLVFGVESEVEFAPVYRGQYLFSDVDRLLRENGFQLMEIMRSKYWKRPVDGKFVDSKGQMMYGDVLYLKDDDVFFESLSKLRDEFFRNAKVLKALVLATLYGHMDYGFEIITKAISGGWFDGRETLLLKRYIDSKKEIGFDIYNQVPMFRGKDRLFNSLYFLKNVFRKKENRWINGAIWK